VQAAIELVKYTTGAIRSPLVNTLHAILIVATVAITSLSVYLADTIVPCVACFTMVTLTQRLVKGSNLLSATRILLAAVIPIASLVVSAGCTLVFATYEASSLVTSSNSTLQAPPVAIELHASLAWIVTHALILALLVYFGTTANARRKLLQEEFEQDITIETLFSLVRITCVDIIVLVIINTITLFFFP